MTTHAHPRVALAAALVLIGVGVTGESIDGSTLMHVAALIVVIAALVAVVLLVSVLINGPEDAPPADGQGELQAPPGRPRPPRV